DGIRDPLVTGVQTCALPISIRRFPAPVRRPAPPFRPVMKRTPPPPTASGFSRGSRVKHPEYGVGVVLTIEGSGDAEKLTVYFDRDRKSVGEGRDVSSVACGT